jgi:hypothetical protein
VNQFRPVTSELRDLTSPVTQFMKSKFTIRDIQKQYRQNIPPIIIPSTLTPGEAAVVGTACDWLLRFLLNPNPDLHLALGGAKLGDGMEFYDSIKLNLPDDDPAIRVRRCIGLAALTHVYRSSRAQDALEIEIDKFDSDGIMSLGTDEQARQLLRMQAVMEEHLLPRLPQGQQIIGPTFTGSMHMPGDGDLIAGNLLLDLKTSIKNALDGKDVYQLLTYLLMDWDNEYDLSEVGIFNARYGYLATWKTSDFGDIPALREEFQMILTGTRRTGDAMSINDDRAGREARQPATSYTIVLAPSTVPVTQSVIIRVANTCDSCGSDSRLMNSNGRHLCTTCWAATWKQAK